MTEEKRGGKREGAGRPKQAETKTLSFRVPKKEAKKLKKLIDNLIADFLSWKNVK